MVFYTKSFGMNPLVAALLQRCSTLNQKHVDGESQTGQRQCLKAELKTR